MDGVHDLGGRQGFHRVDHDGGKNHVLERWEWSVFAMVRALARAGIYRNVDQFRHAVERIRPDAYLTHTYFGRWLGGVENLLAEAKAVGTAEIDARCAVATASSARPDGRALPAPSVGGPGSRRSLATAPRFEVGETVVTASHGHSGHTRLPAYARGRQGLVIAAHGGWAFPDDHAHTGGEAATHLYTIQFSGEELWGAESEPGVFVTLDLFEPYLTAAEGEPA